jgi:phage-related protein
VRSASLTVMPAALLLAVASPMFWRKISFLRRPGSCPDTSCTPTPSVTAMRFGGRQQELRPGSCPSGLAVYHWVLRAFDAEADWLEKAIDQHDAYAAIYAEIPVGGNHR